MSIVAPVAADSFFERKTTPYFALAVAVFYQLLFIFQGLDVVDEGMYMTFYQNIFTHPEDVMFHFMYYLTGIVGGAWLYAFPSLGLLGIRLEGVLVTTLTMVIAYQALKNTIDKRAIFIGLGIALLFCMGGTARGFQYYTFSAFFYAAATYLLVKACTRSSRWLLFAAAIALGANSYVRITNLAGLVFVLVPIFSGYIYKKDAQIIISDCFIFFLGFVAALILGGVGIFAVNHQDVFFSMFSFLKEMAQDPRDSHNVISSASFLVYTYFKGAVEAVCILLLCEAFVFFAYKHKKIIFPAFILLGLMINILIYVYLPSEVSRERFNFTSFFLLWLGGRMLMRQSVPPDARILLLSGIIFLLIYPLGSDLFLLSSIYAAWIVLPMALDEFYKYGMSTNFLDVKKHIDCPQDTMTIASIKNYFTTLVVVTLFIYSLSSIHFDGHSRTQMVHVMQHPSLRFIFTEEKRAQAIDGLTEVLNTKKGMYQYIVSFPHIPLVNFLYGSPPYIRNSWVGLYSDAVATRELERAFHEKRTLPLIVGQKFNLSNIVWPIRIGSAANDPHIKKDAELKAVMEQFMTAHAYRMTWQNDAFEIWEPETVALPNAL